VQHSILAQAASAMGQNESPPFSGLCQLWPASDIALMRLGWGRGKNGFEQSEQTSIYSTTSSARASSVGGTSRPSALAVLRLITKSYLVGACTGRSAGFSLLRMRSM
jgi:hypothetical protein